MTKKEKKSNAMDLLTSGYIYIFEFCSFHSFFFLFFLCVLRISSSEKQDEELY